MTVKQALRILVLVLLAALAVNLTVLRSRGRHKGFTPPAPTAPTAPEWPREQLTPLEQLREQQPGQSPEEAMRELRTKLGWPADFEFPLNILIEDVPEVPERIVGPSPPLD